MLYKITFACALLLAANVEAVRLDSAGRIQDDAEDSATKGGYLWTVGNTQYDETTGEATVEQATLYDTAGNEISSGNVTVPMGGETQEDDE